jgi:membrane protease YdiL (CAAX protease family)
LSVGFLYFAAQIVAGLLIYFYISQQSWTDSQADTWLKSSVYAQFFYVLFTEILLILSLVAMLKLFAWNWRTIGLTKPKLSHIGTGILAVVPYLLLYILIVSVVQQIYPSLNVEQEQQIGFGSTQSQVELMLIFISLVILPPLVEEITMRGFLYSGLRTTFSKVISALAVSVIFGMAHLSQGGDAGPLWIGFIDTFTLSLVLVFLREKTGNLWAGITLHAVKNCIAYVSLFILNVR